MTEYLAYSYMTDSVVASGTNLEDLASEVHRLGYKNGYITNQDGGRSSFTDLFERFDLICETCEDEPYLVEVEKGNAEIVEVRIPCPTCGESHLPERMNPNLSGVRN